MSPTYSILRPPPLMLPGPVPLPPPRTHRFTAHSYTEWKHTLRALQVSQSFETIFYHVPAYSGSTLLRLFSLPQLEKHKTNKQKQYKPFHGRLTFRKSFTSMYLKKV